MPTISLIAAVDENNGLGLNKQLLCHLPADLQHFKNLTMAKPIVMGRKTFESIGKVLPGRINIVLSRSCLAIEGAVVLDSLAKAIDDYNSVDELFIIGGADIFYQSMALASHLYLTRIHHHFEADVFFPNIDTSLWACGHQEFRPHDEKNAYDMTFFRYDK
jgi:dihydrofolate reductase